MTSESVNCLVGPELCKRDRLVAVMVREAEMSTVRGFLSTFQCWAKSVLLGAVMVPNAEMNMLR